MHQSDYTTGLEKSSDYRGQQTYIMYHGTTLRSALRIMHDGFTPSSDGMLGRGVYVSRSFRKACAYPQKIRQGDEQVILKVRVRVGKVKRINYQGHPLQKSWHQAGYDTAWVPPNCGMVPSGLDEDCVWDPKMIEVLEILNKDGTKKDLSNRTFMPGPKGYKWGRVRALDSVVNFLWGKYIVREKDQIIVFQVELY